jgi:hypothetical protein
MRKLLLSISVVFAACAAYAQSDLSRYLEADLLQEHRAKGTVKNVINKHDAPRLVPSVDTAAGFKNEVADLKATVGVEILRIYSGLRRRFDEPEGRLSLCNAFASVSTLKGITYWSHTRKKTRVLFKDSFAIESPENPAKMPDPVFRELPAKFSFYSSQDDVSTGKHFYLTTGVNSADHLWVKTENISSFMFLFIPIVPEKGFVNYSLVVPTENDVLFYGASLICSSFGDAASRTESLTNRVIAMADWLAARLGL